MIIYTLQIKKAGKLVFSHDIALVAGVSFEDQVKAAMDSFRKNVSVSLLDDDVALSIDKKPDNAKRS